MLTIPRVLSWGRFSLSTLLRLLSVAMASLVTYVLMTLSLLSPAATDPHICQDIFATEVFNLSGQNRLETKHFLKWESDFLERHLCVCMCTDTHTEEQITNYETDSEKCFPPSSGCIILINSENVESLSRGGSISSCLFVKSLFMKGSQMKVFAWKAFCLPRKLKLSTSMPVVSLFSVSTLCDLYI